MIKTDLLVRHPYKIYTHKEKPNQKAIQAFEWKPLIIIIEELTNGQKKVISEVSETDFGNFMNEYNED